MKSIPDYLYFLILSILTLPVTIYSYLTIVFNDDIHIYFGVAKIVEAFGSFPFNVDAAYESRPIGNRLIFYILYKLFEPLSANEFLFQIATKSVVAVFALLVCAIFAYTVHRNSSQKYAGYLVFLISALSLFTVHTLCILQTEFFAVILSFLAISMIMHENRWVRGLSGVVMVYIFLLKAITIFMIPVIFAAWWLIVPEHKRWQVFDAVIGLGISAAVILTACILGLPFFLSDLLNLFPVQQAVAPDFVTQTISVLLHSFGVIWFIPVLAIGAITGLFVLYDYLKTKEYAYAVFFGILWGSVVCVQYIQAMYWVYHYVGFIVPAVVSIYLFITKFYSDKPLLVSTLITVSVILVFSVSCSVWSTNYAGMWDQMQSDSIWINDQYHLNDQSSVLYIDQGSAAYYLRAPSYCRYIAPLSIELSDRQHDLSGTKVYQDELSCIMRYNGTYVVMNRGWFGDHTDIDTKLNTEYTIVSNKTWTIYQRAG